MDTKKVAVDGLQIAYHEQGSGRPVVFVHGNSCSKAVFQKQLNSELAEKYRLLALDLPGHGESDRADQGADAYWVSFYSRHIAGFCRELGCPDAVLVGSSLGGHIVLESLPLLPEARGAAILGAPPLHNPPRMTEAFLPNPCIVLAFKEELTDDEIAQWGRLLYGPDIPVPEFSAPDLRQTDPRGRGALGDCVMSLGLRDEVEIARNTPFPLAILHAENETLVSLDYIRGLALPNLWRGEVQIIPAATHILQWERPESFNALLGQYLADLAHQPA